MNSVNEPRTGPLPVRQGPDSRRPGRRLTLTVVPITSTGLAPYPGWDCPDRRPASALFPLVSRTRQGVRSVVRLPAADRDQVVAGVAAACSYEEFLDRSQPPAWEVRRGRC